MERLHLAPLSLLSWWMGVKKIYIHKILLLMAGCGSLDVWSAEPPYPLELILRGLEPEKTKTNMLNIMRVRTCITVCRSGAWGSSAQGAGEKLTLGTRGEFNLEPFHWTSGCVKWRWSSLQTQSYREQYIRSYGAHHEGQRHVLLFIFDFQACTQ